jgi:23S rRNA pseudouridine1911/1915/1917 synthase
LARVRVGDGQDGSRVDHVVAHGIPGLTMGRARRLIEAGAVRVDGRVARKGDRLGPGQTVDVDDAGVRAAAPGVDADAGVPVGWLYVDAALVALDKPAGVPSHPLRAGERGTAANALVARFPECATASPDAREGGLAHRLDNETSGVLLAARTRAAWEALRAALGDPRCEKTYLAEVVGAPPGGGTETSPIGRAGRRGGRVRVGAGRQPLPARTTWEIVERRGGTTLVRARLHAGRAHQVRAHLSAAGFPIVGDAIYGAPAASAAGPVDAPTPTLRLHAHTIALHHPVTGAPLLIEAPPPAWAILAP